MTLVASKRQLSPSLTGGAWGWVYSYEKDISAALHHGGIGGRKLAHRSEYNDYQYASEWNAGRRESRMERYLG